jgi:hypothetical protein
VDEGLRRGTTADTLANLKPVSGEGGVIHAGNSSQISDGAAALLVTSRERAAQLGLTPIVRYIAGAVVGAAPRLVLTGPIPATAKVLARTGLGIDDIGAFEVNEAFAPVPLAWLAETGADPKRLNPLGTTCVTTASGTDCRRCAKAAAPPTRRSWSWSSRRWRGGCGRASAARRRPGSPLPTRTGSAAVLPRPRPR